MESPQTFVHAIQRLRSGVRDGGALKNPVQDLMNEEYMNKQEKMTGKSYTPEAKKALKTAADLNTVATFLNVDMSAVNGKQAQNELQRDAMLMYANDLVETQQGMAAFKKVPVGVFPMETVEQIDTSNELSDKLRTSLSSTKKTKPVKQTRQEDPGIIGMEKGKHVKMAPMTTRRPSYLHRHPQELSPLAMYDEDRLAYQREMAFRRPIPRQEASQPTSPLRMTPLK